MYPSRKSVVSSHGGKKASSHKDDSLDFERVVNSYSIKAERARLIKRLNLSMQESELRHPHVLRDTVILRFNPNGESAKSHHGRNECSTSDKLGHYDEIEPFISVEQHKIKAEKRIGDDFLLFFDDGRAVMRWVLTCTTGLFTGATAIFILFSVEKLVTLRATILSNIMNWTSVWLSFAVFTFFNTILALSSAFLTVEYAPNAASSGIPEVKAYLNGVRTPKFCYFTLLLVKIFGTILSVSSGLMVGPEGPLVHLGAIIGSLITRTRFLELQTARLGSRYPTLNTFLGWQDPRCSQEQPSLWSRLMQALSTFRSDEARRDFISIGAASGFAAAFGAPVGGLLFSMEEASSYFAHRMLFKTLVATTLATFCIACYHGDLAKYSALNLNVVMYPTSSAYSIFSGIPLYAFIGALGGLLGSVFNAICLYTMKRRNQFYGQDNLQDGQKKIYKLLEVLLNTLLTSAVLFWVPYCAPWACRSPTPLGAFEFEVVDLVKDNFNCDTNQINELFKIFHEGRDNTIENILSNPEIYDPRTLLATGIIAYVLMTLSFGMPIPSGIFMPTILSGSALGGLVGIYVERYCGISLSPSTFALLGAAALLAGIQRNTVSLCVIMMEGTGQTKVLIPLIVTICVAVYVGSFFNSGIYEMVIELKHYAYLGHFASPSMDVVKTSAVMSRPVECLHPIESADRIQQVLLFTDHNGFPVVHKESGQFLGLVRRDQLVALLECGVFMKNVENFNQINAYTQPYQYQNLDYPDEATLFARNPFLAGEAFNISDDRFGNMSSRFGPDDIVSRNSNRQKLMYSENTWLLDTVSPSHQNVISVTDETMPKGSFSCSGDTIVALRDGKLIVFLPPEDLGKMVNVAAIMNRGAYTTMEGSPLSKTYSMFTSLGLRHLVVLGSDGKVSGIITRQDLLSHTLEEKLKLFPT